MGKKLSVCLCKKTPCAIPIFLLDCPCSISVERAIQRGGPRIPGDFAGLLGQFYQEPDAVTMTTKVGLGGSLNATYPCIESIPVNYNRMMCCIEPPGPN